MNASAIAVKPPLALNGVVPEKIVKEVQRIHRENRLPSLSSGRHELGFGEIQKEDDRKLIKGVIVSLKQVIIKHFDGDPAAHHPDFAVLALLRDGANHPYHADNVKNHRGMWVPNHTPHRTYSGMLYLNTPDAGGEIHFPQHGVAYLPTPGLMVGFPSNGDYVHGVKPVTAGERHALVFWFSDREAFRLKG